MSAICPWCERVYLPRVSGGSEQRFCSKSCRTAFHTAARKWALSAVDAGNLTVADMRTPNLPSVHAARARELATLDRPMPPAVTFSAEAWLTAMIASGYHVEVWDTGVSRRLAVAFPEIMPPEGSDPLPALGRHAPEVVDFLTQQKARKVRIRCVRAAKKTARVYHLRASLTSQSFPQSRGGDP